MSFGWIDLVFALVVLVSLLVGLLRGLLREVLSLVSWAVAGVLAYLWATGAGKDMFPSLADSEIALAGSTLAIFVVAVFVLAIVSNIVAGRLRAAGIRSADSVLGAAFGALRGLFILAVVVLAVEATRYAREPVWQQSPTVQYLIPLKEWISEVFGPWVEDSGIDEELQQLQGEER